MRVKPIDRFVDSVNGNDANDGTSLATAWKSLDNVTLMGDKDATVFIARGSVFKSAFPDTMISGLIFDGESFGTGNLARFDGRLVDSILSGSHDNLLIQGLHFYGTKYRHVNCAYCNNVQFIRCHFEACGLNQPHTDDNYQSAYFYDSGNISFDSCKFYDGSWGDHIFLKACDGLLSITNCRFGTPKGVNADNVQIYADDWTRANIQIIDNVMDMSKPTNSGKGNVCINRMYGRILIDHNELLAHNYGLSLACDDVEVSENRISGAELNSYSWGIGIGEAYDTKNHTYTLNLITDCKRAFTFSAMPNTTPTHENCVVTSNDIVECNIALRIDTPTTGKYDDNTVQDVATKQSITVPIPDFQIT